jgi:hypothetical protein
MDMQHTVKKYAQELQLDQLVLFVPELMLVEACNLLQTLPDNLDAVLVSLQSSTLSSVSSTFKCKGVRTGSYGEMLARQKAMGCDSAPMSGGTAMGKAMMCRSTPLIIIFINNIARCARQHLSILTIARALSSPVTSLFKIARCARPHL